MALPESPLGIGSSEEDITGKAAGKFLRLGRRKLTMEKQTAHVQLGREMKVRSSARPVWLSGQASTQEPARAR